MNPGNGFRWRLQRAFSRCSPLHDETGYRARTPLNLYFDLSRLADPIQLHGFNRHAQQLFPFLVSGRLRAPDRR